MERLNEIFKSGLVSDLISGETYYRRMVEELGDALQAIASPNEELNNDEVRIKVLGTIAEVRSGIQHILGVLSGAKIDCTEEHQKPFPLNFNISRGVK